VRNVLFVTNGHGEAAIAERISLELRSIAPDARLDHLALVGTRSGDVMNEVGPRRAMPSGGLIAMGNARNLAQDLRAGLLALTWSQALFLRRARGRYTVAVAVGDTYALLMTLLARAQTVFVGTAKSVEVAPYGAFETRVLARTAACYVRDPSTALTLRRRGIDADAANAIADLAATPGEDSGLVEGFAPALGLFPGSRESAYDDGAFLLEVIRRLGARRPTLGAVLSIAPGLVAERFARDARRAGWLVNATQDVLIPFIAGDGDRTIVRAWRGELGAALSGVALVLGQAGTANEAAAAAGVPVVAFERDRDRKARWYRQRQRGLLGEALAVFPGSLDDAVKGVEAILDDPQRRRHMGETGRARMGEAGGAKRIAERIASLVDTA
jgi:uncharacterized protein (TIGR03492 family)